MKKILIIDDDRIIGESLSLALGLLGHRAAACPDAETALRRAKDGGYEVFLIDYNMPGMSGLDLSLQLRERFPRALIIGMSGFDMAEAFSRAGADHFLRKPVNAVTIETLFPQDPSAQK
jgi:DNA-binding NtrC family response regulator